MEEIESEKTILMNEEEEEKDIKTFTVELSEGQTSQSDVIGTSFNANPLGKIKIKGKKEKEEKCSSCESNKSCYSECELDFSELEEFDTKNLNIEKRGDKWCVVHGSPFTGSSRDKPIGSVIKCFPKKEDAERMHNAIVISKIKNKNMEEISNELENSEKELMSDKLNKEIILTKSYRMKSVKK